MLPSWRRQLSPGEPVSVAQEVRQKSGARPVVTGNMQVRQGAASNGSLPLEGMFTQVSVPKRPNFQLIGGSYANGVVTWSVAAIASGSHANLKLSIVLSSKGTNTATAGCKRSISTPIPPTTRSRSIPPRAEAGEVAPESC